MQPPDTMFAPFHAIKIQCHDWLPHGTIVVSRDIWDLLRTRYSEQGNDQEFLKLLGISDADSNSIK